MKKLLLCALLCAFSGLTKAQTLDCKRFKNGVFKISYNGNTDIVTRRGDMQTEVHNNTDTATFKVKWLGPCCYTLQPTQATFKKQPNLPKNATLTINITNTTANSYTMSISSNFFNGTQTCEMQKVD